MTPKEKADELITKYINQWFAFGDYLCIQKAKQCALIAVDEIIASNPRLVINWAFSKNQVSDNTKYWQEVKQEIQNL